jgi:hypothetical protein
VCDRCARYARRASKHLAAVFIEGTQKKGKAMQQLSANKKMIAVPYYICGNKNVA